MARLTYLTPEGIQISCGLPVSGPVQIVAEGEDPVRRLVPGDTRRTPILVPRPGSTHVLIAPPDMDVLVGCPLIGGASVLEDQDQLRVGDWLLRYTTWDWIDPMRREVFDGPDGALCPIDGAPILPKQEVIFCPKCGYAMHSRCVSSGLTACIACECPVAHTEEQALQIAAAGGGLK